MSIFRRYKHIFTSYSIPKEEKMPQSISLKLDVGEITSVTPKPQPEKILESDNNILPMRFSKDRDTFHTTNSKGEIVKHRLCPDVSFNDASYVDNMIRKLAQANIEAPEGDKVFSYINKKTCDKFSIDKSPTIYEVSDENLSLKRHLTLSFFHANLPLDWFRLKIAYSEFIKVLGLDAVLSDQPNNSELYKKQDESLAWALISLIHFPIFKQRGDEFNFWRSFRNKKQKTLYLFNFINNAVKEHLTSSTPELTTNIMMRHALPKVSSIVLALDLSMDKQLIIKHYIKDPDTTSEFTGPFRLLDLPLEILFRVLVFLDDPEMRSLAETCRTLRNVARERFIQRSKFFYVRDKIGIRLTELRPALSELYHQHIVPVQNVNMLGNTAHVTVINDLQRSFRRDSLSKSLQKRPMLSELKEKNIIPLDSSTSPLIKTRVKELKQENLSQMLQLLLKSYRFQKKIVNSDVDVNVKISTFESPGDQSSTTAPQDLPSPDRKTLISKIEIIEKKRQGKVNSGQYHDVSDEFIRIYNRLCSRFGHTIKPSNQRSLSTPVPSSASVNSTSPSTPLRAKNHPLNQLPPLNSSPISTIKSTRRTDLIAVQACLKLKKR
ncbi:Mitochondrial F-box protein MFB1 [Cyberlindnera fabianii]|uniref:Mitochondrial F-box protein MFB1 n=1 Tax=Cyberlindnera fabianii TaxID=36022 RepID=A0A1V2L0P7_CYBFA|nr:Mitochondrial F-box protein MFB1 [Cyberlindnera fabianii]